jgi:hypothetical protein
MNYYLKEIATLKNTGDNVISIKRAAEREYEACIQRILAALQRMREAGK